MPFIQQARRHHYLFALCTVGPVFLLFLFIRIIPVIRTAILSFTDYSLMSRPQFTGLYNYLKLLTDENFRIALLNTSILAFTCVTVTLSLALLLSVLMASTERASGLYSLIYFIPVVIPWVPASVIWRWILDPKLGILNFLLSSVGLPGQSWLQHPHQNLIPVMIVAVWKTLGYYILVFFVGLRNIPPMYYDAAEIDGANARRRFFLITLPLMKPIVLFSVIMAIIHFFNIFTLAYSLSSSPQGSPSYETKVLVWEIYRNGFAFHKMGYASAQAVFLLIVVVVLILVQFRTIRYDT